MTRSASNPERLLPTQTTFEPEANTTSDSSTASAALKYLEATSTPVRLETETPTSNYQLELASSSAFYQPQIVPIGGDLQSDLPIITHGNESESINPITVGYQTTDSTVDIPDDVDYPINGFKLDLQETNTSGSETTFVPTTTTTINESIAELAESTTEHQPTITPAYSEPYTGSNSSNFASTMPDSLEPISSTTPADIQDRHFVFTDPTRYPEQENQTEVSVAIQQRPSNNTMSPVEEYNRAGLNLDALARYPEQENQTEVSVAIQQRPSNNTMSPVEEYNRAGLNLDALAQITTTSALPLTGGLDEDLATKVAEQVAKIVGKAENKIVGDFEAAKCTNQNKCPSGQRCYPICPKCPFGFCYPVEDFEALNKNKTSTITSGSNSVSN